MSIQQRKKDHVDLSVSGEVNYRQATGFERYQFIHNSLPEIDLTDVTTETPLLGRTFSFPLFISSMTGGYTEAGAVNAIIAEFCQEHNLPFGVGSQRAMLENPETAETFSIVRERAPDAFIASNIGGAQLIGGLHKEKLNLLTESIRADAIIVHLNPLQELLQPEGDRNFKGIREGIRQLVRETKLPVIVKETGAGISGDVAEQLLDAGVKVIDIAGAGGTSWAKVENKRAIQQDPLTIFDDWGIATVDSLLQVHRLKPHYGFELIASGGIRTSIDIAKALCLGADFTAAAQPVIRAVVEEGREGLELLFQRWQRELQTLMVLLGCERPVKLERRHLRLNIQSP